MGGPTPRKKTRRIHKLRPAGPKPRAAFAVDAVLTRSGNIDIRRQYAGPKDVDPVDLVNLVSGIVAAWVSTAFLDPEVRDEVKGLLLDTLDQRIVTAAVSEIEGEEE